MYQHLHYATWQMLKTFKVCIRTISVLTDIFVAKVIVKYVKLVKIIINRPSLLTVEIIHTFYLLLHKLCSP